MDKSLGTLLHFWRVFQFTQAQPLPSPTNNVGHVHPEFFLSLNFVWGWGGRGRREMQENFEKEALFDKGTQNDRKICPKDFCLWLYRFDFKITAFSNDFYSVLYQQYCYSLRWVVDSICPAFSLLVCASCICCRKKEESEWNKYQPFTT